MTGLSEQPADQRGPALVGAVEGYTDLVRIGVGGSSVVYRARQELLARTVALKVFAAGADERAYQRFQREAELTARLSGHPNVVTALDSGVTSSGQPYLVTAFYERGSLHDRIAADGPLPAAEVARIGAKIADALAAAHEVGLLHRDVKPANILVSRYGEPALADFGTAHLATGQASATRLDVFSPHHVAPEVLGTGKSGPAADVYALGSTLYHLATGQAPHATDDGTLATVLWRVVNAPVPVLDCPDLPGLAPVLARVMAKEPGDRHASAREFATALRALVADDALAQPVPNTPAEPVTDLPVPEPTVPIAAVAPPPWHRRRPVLVGGAVALVAVVTVAMTLTYNGAGQPAAGQVGQSPVAAVAAPSAAVEVPSPGTASAAAATVAPGPGRSPQPQPQPTTAPRRPTRQPTVAPPAKPGPLLSNGTFGSGTSPWWGSVPAVKVSGDGGRLRAVIASGTPNPWDAMVAHDFSPLVKDASYTLSFDASASARKTFPITVQMGGKPYTNAMWKSATVDTSTRHFSYTFTPSFGTDWGLVSFQLGANGSFTFWLDNVTLTRG
ncbi:protein kinase domain-containing protein [Catellatospora tritici]|uniref:protein kinase domain-containing protein n=1 Tax=Catellatospora tritici TaxID=2851566 RepID=UPI001C2D1E6A|nr:protein kinase [Catellatospora tritici]MBV1855629.1 protein kinase [Catellatospora tritici]